MNALENNVKWLAGVAACLAACTAHLGQFHTLALQVASGSCSAGPPLEQLAQDRAFARWLRKRYAPAMLHPPARTGIDRATALDARLHAALRSTYAAALAPVLCTLDAAIVATCLPDEQLLDRLFGRPGKQSPACTLDSPQAALAGAVRLISYVLPGHAPATLSVADILQRQDMQGRRAFFTRDTAFMLQQARERVAQLLVLDWAHGRFGADALAELRQAFADQDDVRAAMRLYGLDGDGGQASPIQQALARRVTKADIRAWYRQQKEQFRRVERVLARHISVATASRANALLARLEQGEDFATLAIAQSLAPDAVRGGALGWVRVTVDPCWLDALVLQQPVGAVAGPFCHGVGRDARWEIVLVERRVESYQPAGSEMVGEIARKAIALERAHKEFAAARAQAFMHGV